MGDYNRVRLEAIANIPLSDNFAFRIAAMYDNHDGFIENTWIPGTSDDLNDRDAKCAPGQCQVGGDG